MSKFTRAIITLFISDFIHELYSTIVSSKVSTVQSSLFYLIAFIIFAMRGALTSDRRIIPPLGAKLYLYFLYPVCQ